MLPLLSRSPRGSRLSLAALLFSALCLSALALAAPARAATLTVTSTADPTGAAGTMTLRDAITAAQTGDTITFDPTVFAAGSQNVITLASALPTITHDLTIQGPGAGVLAVDGNNQFPVFAITGGTVALSGLTIQHGSSGTGGGVAISSGVVTLTGCTLTGNFASSGGGVGNYGTVTLTGCTLSGNGSANGGGGGVFNGGTATLTGCTLSGNIAGGGGSVLNNNGDTLTLTDDVLYGDTGGEISDNIGGVSGVTATYCDVQSGINVGTDAANHILNVDPQFVSASDLHLTSTSPCFRAGTDAALATDHDGNPYGSPPTIGAYEITGQTGQGYVVTNINDSGAGSLRAAVAYADANASTQVTFDPSVTGTITLTSGEIDISQDATVQGPGAGTLAVDGNHASRVFGITGGTVAISGLTIQNGTAPSDGAPFNAGGGGVALSGGMTNVRLTDCTLIGNSAGQGGGVAIASGTATLTGCVFSGNSASGGSGGSGGGVLNEGELTLLGCTFSGNTAPNGGGGAVQADGNTILVDDILYGNNSPLSGGELGGTNFLPLYCDIRGIGVNSNGLNASRHDIDADPLFVRNPGTYGMTDHGDLHLQGTSPALAAGISAVFGFRATDHDGLPYFTPPALGAYEGPQVSPQATHVLWDNPDGKTIFWDVNNAGAHLVAGIYGPYQDDASGSTGYTATSLATGPNGVSYILWTNPAGVTYLWAVRPDGTHTDYRYGPFSDDGTQNTLWQAVAVSAGGDGKVHLLWTNPNNRTILWDVDGATGEYVVQGNYGGFSDDGTASTVWKAFALATGPDGLSHILWNNPDGRTLLWDLDMAEDAPTGAGGGSASYAYGPFFDDGTPNTIWTARALSVGPDGGHILWNNLNGHTILWDVAGDGTFTIPGNYGAFADDASGNTSYTAVSLATGADGVSHFAWDNPDGNSYLWSVNNTDGSHTDTFYPPFYDGSDAWQAVAVSAAVSLPPI